MDSSSHDDIHFLVNDIVQSIKTLNSETKTPLPVKSILLNGGPGTGKTHFLFSLKKALPDTTIVSIQASDLYVKFKPVNMHQCFQEAKEKQPSILTIDDIFLIFTEDYPEKDQIKQELIHEIELFLKEEKTIFIATTLYPWTLDLSFIEMFQKIILFDVPNEENRLETLKNEMKRFKLFILTNEELKQLVDKTKGYTYPDLKILIRESYMRKIRVQASSKYFKKITGKDIDGNERSGLYAACQETDEGATQMNFFTIDPTQLAYYDISYDDVLQALSSIRQSISNEEREEYKKWNKEHIK